MKIGVSKKPAPPVVAVKPLNRPDYVALVTERLNRDVESLTISQEANYLAQLTELFNNNHLMQMLQLRDHEYIIMRLNENGLTFEDVDRVWTYYYDESCTDDLSPGDKNELYWSCLRRTMDKLNTMNRPLILAAAERHVATKNGEQTNAMRLLERMRRN